MANVKVIPARENRPKTLRVAAYCRVSSDSTDQMHSYATQIRNYTEEINKHDDWELVDIYADPGLTGTRMDKRDDFNRMLSDCRKGKIDKILVKSVSRFARNTRDCLAILRELNALGVSVLFEKENINTDTLTTELMVSVSGSLAQEESVSISKNQRMSYQRRMQRGEFITCLAPFGYQLVDGKNLIIKEDEAKIVRWIFDRYLAGYSSRLIAESLTAKNVPTPRGKKVWIETAVRKILVNEKYIGDTLCQKSYTTDTFPFERRNNHGEVDQFYISCTHPAIITRDLFEKAQEVMKRRAERMTATPETHPLSKKVFCGECGCLFSRKVSTNGYAAWCCRKHLYRADDCPAGRVSEEDIYATFIRMYNKLKLHEGILLKPALDQFHDFSEAIQRENPAMLAVNQAIADVAEQSHKVSLLQDKGLLDADACASRLQEINTKLTQLRRERRRLIKNDEIGEALTILQRTIDTVRNGPERIEGFDESLFSELVDKIIVNSKTQVCFHLYGGIELREALL